MKIIAIGQKSNITQNKFTGVSVMFDGVVDRLKYNGDLLSVIDISKRFDYNSIFLRSIDYFLVFLHIFLVLLLRRYDLAYITTALSQKGFYRDYIIIRILRLFNVKVIAHQYGANYQQLLDALNKKGMKYLTEMLDYISIVLVEGEYMKNQYSFYNNYENKVRIIPNGLPTVGKEALRPKKYAVNKPFRMFYLSNLIWSKGYFDVLQAVDLLVNKYNKKVECIFAGQFMASVDDPNPAISNKEDFDRFVSEHHLDSVVSYYPGMYGEEKDSAFSKSHVFLLPTYYINEGQPVSIIEAMAYGCVPIVTYYRHIPMMVNNNNGCFVEPKNPQQIAEAIVALMENPEEYAAKSIVSINDYKENFTFEFFVSKVINYMNEVAKL